MRVRRREQQCSTRLRLANREPVHDRDGSVDGHEGVRMIAALLLATALFCIIGRIPPRTSSRRHCAT